MSSQSSRISRVLMTGPLAPFAVQYRDRLKERGYSPLSVVNLERQAAQMSRWLQVEGLGVAEMSEARIDAFMRFVRADIMVVHAILIKAIGDDCL